MGIEMGGGRDTEAMMHRFAGQLRDYALVLLDPEGFILSWNVGAEKIKGYTADEIVGTHFSVFYTEEARSVGHPDRELMIAAAAGTFQEVGWRVRKDGSRFWGHVTIEALRDDQGELEGFGKVTHDLTAIKQSTEQMANITALLDKTARTDFLTGLENRRSLDQLMGATLSSAARYQRPLVLAMLDLDRFKVFNDEHGHQNGDRYLRRAAVAWRRVLRCEDVLARYGGEEFTILMPDTPIAQGLEALDRVRTATPDPLTCSFGVAEWDGEETGDALITRADRALYAAKTSGRNRMEVWPKPCSVVQALSGTRPGRVQEEVAASREQGTG